MGWDLPSSAPSRERAAWWGVVAVLAAVVGLVALKLLGTFLLGVFMYYGARPMHRRVERHSPSQGLAATATLLVTALPFLLVAGYFAVLALGELAPQLAEYRSILATAGIDVDALLTHPARQLYGYLMANGASTPVHIDIALSYLGHASNWLANVGVALLVAFTLLRDGHRLRAWFARLVGPGSLAMAYASAVDADLESVYFSNVIIVAFVAIVSELLFQGYNVLAPPAVALPFPTVLAIAMGLASLVPLIAGKVVYLPAAGYLGWQAAQVDDALLVFPLAFLLVTFVVADFVPLTFVLPQIAGRRMDLRVELVMFGYVVGTVVFGWYGLFLGPLLVVLVAEAADRVLPRLVHRDPLDDP
ncbi:AI-2E family transporter [Halocalculus aciditolerans]|uniref:AI-2E family transporter n=1 Tax=Halocalculus aciditolerans TaxID=1383812 RepID=A0A830FFI2_9EURY|nr:AI-2E family transporter [Halocalculus aciditolerans]GGL50294.1 AI-2E family transporter [Halocalculus aciditolerans]